MERLYYLVAIYQLLDILEISNAGRTRDDTGEVSMRKIPLLKRFAVFNVEQTTLQLDPLGTEDREHNPEASADDAIRAYQDAGGPEIVHTGGSLALYSIAHDLVKCPRPTLCVSGPAYYSTVLHELAHSTGAKHRLNRSTLLDQKRDSPEQAEEELIAELATCFVRASLGLEHGGEEKNSAAYCQYWVRNFRRDPKLFVRAAGKAQKAADLILGVTWDDRDTDQEQETATPAGSTRTPEIEYKGRPTARPRPLQDDPAPTLFG